MNELYFEPATVLIEPNQEFQVELMLDTQGISIDGVDVILPLRGAEVIKLEHSGLMRNVFESKEGVLKTSYIAELGQKFAGKGTLTTITFKSIENKILDFDFTVGETIDTNMAVNGVDILTDVGNLEIKIKPMAINSELLAALQALATQFQVELKGTVTPVTPVGDEFDLKP